MPRAIWSGAISFGLVNVPVRIYSAIEEHKLRFHFVHRKDDSPIGYQKICKKESKPVPDKEIVKAFEYRKGEYVYMEEQLIESFSARWDPSKYEDTYHDALLDVIKAKRKGEEVHRAPEPKEEEPADLMAALRASVDAAKGRRSGASRDGLSGLSKAELDERARKAGISGRSKMSKQQLVRALSRAA